MVLSIFLHPISGLGPRAQEAVREYANKMRAREPRPYLDINKMFPNNPECRVYPYCQGRGGVSPPVAIFSLKMTNFAFSGSLPGKSFRRAYPGWFI